VTVFGWDVSHYDWDRGLTAAKIQAAAGAGIAFMTHKIGEGTGYTDPRFDDFWRASRPLRDRVLLGAYYVLHPGSATSQADRFMLLLDRMASGWRDGPWIIQVDAERWPGIGEPSLAEIRAFVTRLRAKAIGYRPVVYAPKWVYGDGLRGLGAPLWASNYGSNPAQPFKTAYPGDASSRWAAYSGQTPALLQYGSRTRIDAQGTCDANAFRGSLAELRALVYPVCPGGEDEMTPSQQWIQHVMNYRVEALRANRSTITIPARPDLGTQYRQIVETNGLAATLSLLAGRPADEVVAEIRAQGEQTRAALLAAVAEQAPTLAAAVVERLGTEVTAAEIGEALARELAAMLAGATTGE
jgi:GH25 family lysozyme M1 (1,4-beta-N-acetylmuramidase)